MAKEVWDGLADYDEDQTLSQLQDEDDLVYWGHDKKTTYNSFKNRLTQIFKRNPGFR